MRNESKNLMKRIVSLLFVLSLAACTGMPGKLASSDLEPGGTVAVVSLLGESFHGIHIAPTVFGNIDYEAAVPDWNIDTLTEHAILPYLTQTDFKNGIVLKHDSGLSQRLKDGWSFMHNGYDYDEIIGLAKAQGADKLILVQPVAYDNAPFYKPGYGFYERTSLLGKSNSCVYSLFLVSVFSTHTGERLGMEWKLPCNMSETELEWKDGFDKYSPNELELIRHKTEASVKEGVLGTLKLLGYLRTTKD
ncbi:MAG: hypothetical protein WDM70_06580 [Nitrosomonadales bacterium]